MPLLPWGSTRQRVFPVLGGLLLQFPSAAHATEPKSSRHPSWEQAKGFSWKDPLYKDDGEPTRRAPPGLLQSQVPPKESVYGGTRGSPLPQGDSSQLDQVPHAGRDEDGGFVAVAGFVVAFHLLHHELGMSQERVLCEAVEVQPRGRYGGLRGGGG